jgi:long-chain acyl-CoA synthetase
MKHPPELPPLTLPQMLREQARHQPARVAIHQKDFGIWNPLTWEAYYRRACHVGIGLRLLGLPAGGHLGVLSENRLEWVLAQMGAGLVGAITVGMYPTSPTPEVFYVLAHADVDIVVCEDQEQTDKVLAALDQLPCLQKIVVVEAKGLRSYEGSLHERIVVFDELEQLGCEYEATHRHLVEQTLERQSLDDLGLVIYTSGSTGKPKGAMISYRNIRGVTPGIIDRLALSEATTHLSYLPLCHVAEQMLTTFVPVYLGSQVNFGESIRTVQEDLREVAPTVFLGVPRIWEKLYSSIYVKLRETGAVRRWLIEQVLALCELFCELDRSQRSPVQQLLYQVCYWLVWRALLNYVGLRRVQIALTGAAPISPAIIRFFRTIGVPLVEVYGLTESTGMILGQRRTAVQIGTVGEPILGVEHRVAETGELLIRGEMVFAGYYKNPEATAATVIDGWLHTGDVVVGQDGQLRIVDRLKDIMITAGGKNLSPSEIENTMKASSYIKECIIVADRRRYVAALVQLDFQTVSKWAEERRIPFTHYRSLAENEQVCDLIAAEIERGNRRLAPVEQVRRFHILTKELDHDDGEVTATMKVRRAAIYRLYANEIEALYAGNT